MSPYVGNKPTFEVIVTDGIHMCVLADVIATVADGITTVWLMY